MIGRVSWVEDAADFIATERLGPDALDRRFDFAAFKARMLGPGTVRTRLNWSHSVIQIFNA
jgi:hypothetical protein